jgi:uncharacterized protein (DUF1697 family)
MREHGGSMRHVALLKGINLGRRQVPMAALRDLAAQIGLENPRTYVASGNLLFESEEPARHVEERLEAALAARFGFTVDVVVRSSVQWQAYRAGNPFPQESEQSPNLVMISVGKQPPRDDDVERLRTRATAGEKVERVGDVLWLYFAGGAARSKLGLGPAGGIWTARNWRTVVKIDELLWAPA